MSDNLKDLTKRLNEAWSWGKKPKAPEPAPAPPAPLPPLPPRISDYDVISLSEKESEEYLATFSSNGLPKIGQPEYYYPYAKALCEGKMDLRKIQPNLKLLCKHLKEWANELEDENWHAECGYISDLAEYYEKGKIKVMRYRLARTRRKLDFATWVLNGKGKYKTESSDSD